MKHRQLGRPGDGTEVGESAGELRLGLLGRLDGGGAHRLGARLGGPHEHLLLVGGVALDGLDQVGDEIVAALELDVDAAPGFVDPVAAPDDRVPDEDPDEPDKEQEGDDDDYCDQHCATS